MDKGQYYILDDKHQLVPTNDVLVWGEWFEDIDNRRVARDELGDVSISTVCLGSDHSFGDGPPLLFETMIFGGEHGGKLWRCSTWDEALEQHRLALAMARAEAEKLSDK